MDSRDRTTRDAVAEIAQLLAIAYQRCRRARRIEVAAKDAPESFDGELDNPHPEKLHVRELTQEEDAPGADRNASRDERARAARRVAATE